MKKPASTRKRAPAGFAVAVLFGVTLVLASVVACSRPLAVAADSSGGEPSEVSSVVGV
jgi:hypothetical protein